MDPRMAEVVGGDDGYYPPHPLDDPMDSLARHYKRVPGGILAALASAAEYEGNPEWAAQLDPATYDMPMMRNIDDIEREYPVSAIRELLSLGQRSADDYEASQAAMLSGLRGEDIAQQFTPLVDTGDEYGNYLMRPASIDPRLAEAKRLYAGVTGRMVETPEDAAKAWELYKNSQQQLNDPVMGEDYQWYERYPELMQQMLERMPGVVSTTESPTYG